MFDSIIFFILFGIGLFVAFKIIKSIVKVLMIGLIIVLLVGGVLGLMFYRDAKDLRANFGTEPKLLLLDSDGSIMAGVVVKEGLENMSVVEDLETLDILYKEERYRALVANYTRVIVFKEEFFIEGLPETIELEEFIPQTFDKDEMLELLTSNSTEDYKAYVFLSAVGHTMELRGSTFLYSQYKSGNVVFYPNTIVFYFAKRAPKWLVVPVIWFLSL